MTPTPHPQLWDALLAYQTSPGRFAVARREPAVLFDHTLALLALAADRPVELPGGEPVPAEVRQAARFFVRSVMLRPGNDHYTLMGVGPEADAVTLKEHYRLLMRLTHPDFQSDGDPWPDDAAARVNLAYDVLASPVQRANYDAQRARAVSDQLHAVAAAARASAPRTPVRHRPEGRSPARRSAWLAGALVAGTGAVVALLWQTPEDPSLTVVQKPTPAQPVSAAEPVPPEPAVLVLAPAEVEPQEQVEAKPAAPLAAVAAATPAPAPKPATRPVTAPLREAKPPVARRNPRNEPRTEVAGLSYSLSTPNRNAPPPPAASPESDGWGETLALALAIDRATTLGGARVQPRPADMRPMQPLLADLLHMLETGQTERVRRWAASQTHQEDAAARFARAYGRTLAGAEVAGLGQAQFDLREADGQPVVHGTVQIRLRETGRESTVLKDFRLRAHFRQQEGGPTLSRLEAE
jgi:hypothetical protein